MPDTTPLKLIIPAEFDGERLDRSIARLCPEHSRARIQAWIRKGEVRVDGEPRRQRDTVRCGQEITITASAPAVTTGDRAEDIPLDILYEDEALLVVNKPAGLVVHPGAGNPRHTLLNALLHHAPELGQIPRAGIVQRLDKDTSGIMVVARTQESHTYLVSRLAQRRIRRQYLALACGRLTAGGSVDAPVGRHHGDRTRMAVVATGRPAVTHYRVIERFQAHTLLRVLLETGRTHQIRVHMAHLHHPLVGDPVYGGRRMIPGGVSAAVREAVQAFPRQALHACELSLAHPLTGAEVSWTAPLPADINSLLHVLREQPRTGTGPKGNAST